MDVNAPHCDFSQPASPLLLSRVVFYHVLFSFLGVPSSHLFVFWRAISILSDKICANHSRCENANFMTTHRVLKRTSENRVPRPIKVLSRLFLSNQNRFNTYYNSKVTKPKSRYAFIPKSDTLSPESK